MDLRRDLKEQYHAGLAMLAECVASCPYDLWLAGRHPRPFWRIAFHAAFFTHLYMGQNADVFTEPSVLSQWPPAVKNSLGVEDWAEPGEVEPYELSADAEPLTKEQILQYIGFVDSLVDSTIDSLDLDSSETGFYWYKGMSKMSHELMNLRHLQGHVGQLSELLMSRGIDTNWIAIADAYTKYKEMD
ncbi:MAG TPA: hypothetical protein VNK96_10325 [Fimbriimonadales bacterium]|nr:hypothetical protein [Fimbriimonadales bacterium]